MIKYAFYKTLPIMFSYVFLGIAFGIMMHDAGLGPGWSGLMGIMVYTGAFQIAFVGLLKGGATLAEMVITAFVLGSRHIFYGFSFLEDFRKGGRKFLYLVFSLTDESYALDCALKEPEGMNRQSIEFLMHIMCQAYWVMGGVLGGLIGKLIPFDFTGIDFCMTALFTTIMVDQWIEFGKQKDAKRKHIPAILGAASTIFFLIILGTRNFLFPAMLITTMVLFFMSVTEKEERSEAADKEIVEKEAEHEA